MYNWDIIEPPTCRKWNVQSLINYAMKHVNEAGSGITSAMLDYKFIGDILTFDSDGRITGTTTETLVSSDEFLQILKQKFFTFGFLTPYVYDYDTNTLVDSTNDDNYTNPAMAYRELYKTWQVWQKDNQKNFGDLYNAIMQKYNPINNYDRHSNTTVDFKGRETTVETPTGTETDTYTKSGKETTVETPSGSETDTLTKSGKETNTNTPTGTESKTTAMTGSETDTETPSGSETVTHNIGAKTTTTGRTTYDDATFNNTEQISENARIDSDVTTYSSKQNQNVKTFTNRQNTETTSFTQRETKDELSFVNRQDVNVKSFDNRQTETETSFTNRQDTNVKSFTNRQTETDKSFTNRQDETNEYAYGNIGVTLVQKMAMSSFELAEIAHLKEYIVNDFVKRYLVK